MVSDDVIQQVLSGDDDEAAAEELLQLALENGGTDNVSLVICRVTEVDGV